MYGTREGTCEFYFLTCSDDLICCWKSGNLYLHSGLHKVNNMRSRQRNIHNITTWWYIKHVNFQDASREKNIGMHLLTSKYYFDFCSSIVEHGEK